MLAAADRIPTLRRQLAGMHPYGLTTNPGLARWREHLEAELQTLVSGSATHATHSKEDDDGQEA
jgi:hypothetical protein